MPSTAQRPAHRRQKTQCFVHALLEKHDGVSEKDRNASYEGLAQERMLDKDPHGHADESQHSRLLTKKQISDMAFGIRELSKKLAQIRLKLHVRNIFILAKAHDETLIRHTRETVDWLLTKDPSYRVYVEETLEQNKLFDAKSLLQKESFGGRLKFWTNELCHDRPQTFDIALAVSFSPRAHPSILNPTARRRRHRPLRLMALSAHRPARPCLLPRLPRIPHQIRL